MNARLDKVRVATPCHASWDQMTGDDRRRFCGECQLHVYNLSAMTRAEAEAFVRQAEGRACIRMYRRADGTLLTQDCPVGLLARTRQAARQVWRRLAAAALLVASLVVGGVGCDRTVTSGGKGNGASGGANAGSTTGGGTTGGGTVPGTNRPFEPPEGPEVIMGNMCPPEEWENSPLQQGDNQPQ